MIATFTRQEETGTAVDEAHNPVLAQKSTHPGIIPCLFPHPHLPNITATSLSRQEETGAAVDETHNPFLAEEGDPLLAKREQEMQKRMTRRDGTVMSLAQVGQSGVGGGVAGKGEWDVCGREMQRCIACRSGTVMSLAQGGRVGVGILSIACASRTDGMGG